MGSLSGGLGDRAWRALPLIRDKQCKGLHVNEELTQEFVYSEADFKFIEVMSVFVSI